MNLATRQQRCQCSDSDSDTLKQCINVVTVTVTLQQCCQCSDSDSDTPAGWLVGWGLTALLTQNRSYRACRFVGIFYSKL